MCADSLDLQQNFVSKKLLEMKQLTENLPVYLQNVTIEGHSVL